ncbi:MAG TPA: polysaccharide deacetylase family protein [Acidimicrobiia bacterium]|jgi:peptidoglycan/xylan/chitin deacetylase (PgdA/CDA1 family)
MTGPDVVPILLYHSVCDDPPPALQRWTTPPARFREHLEFFAGEGYQTLTVSAYVARLRSGSPLVGRVAVVTFDDGYADFADEALPALVDTATACTLYLSTAYMGATSSWLGRDGEHPMLSWDAAAKVAAAGVEIGAHAHRHVALDELAPRDARTEIVRSKDEIEQRLGRPVESFAYPHGYHGPKVKAIVRDAGFANACGVKNALSGPGDDEYGLARVMLEGDVSTTQLRALLADLGRAPARERLDTTLWRMYRRTRARVRPHTHRTTTVSAP